MLDRTQQPPIRLIERLQLPEPRRVLLNNGIPLYILDYPEREILKIELACKGGRTAEQKRGVARATAQMLREGSRSMTAAAIAEHIDFYGASFSAPSGLDGSNFALYGLRKYAEALLPVFAETLLYPVFPENELETYRQNNVRELLIELEKADVLAYRKITEQIFGADHPYGYNSTPEDYRSLVREDLVECFGRMHRPAYFSLFAMGRIDDDALGLIEQHFGQFPPGDAPAERLHPPAAPTTRPATTQLPHPGHSQTAISIGRRLFNRRHPDHDGVFVLNTVLGGYFGSRLMTNIREKRGYTYNIYSTVDTMLHDGCLYIAAEVSSDKVKATIREIRREMKRLCDERIGDDEMEMVRNYLSGVLLNSLDGPMNTAEAVKSLIVDDMPLDTYERLLHVIQTITPEQLRDLAQRYLQIEDYWIVTVGGE